MLHSTGEWQSSHQAEGTVMLFHPFRSAPPQESVLVRHPAPISTAVPVPEAPLAAGTGFPRCAELSARGDAPVGLMAQQSDTGPE